MVTVSAILLIPILVMVYDIFFVSAKDEMLLQTKQERLETIVKTTVRGLDNYLIDLPQNEEFTLSHETLGC
ncbi:hypothetical protein N752_02825 [Desulforamulus aquiferis]|nr:hypothetical protein [Desulforamulus aquiferis]RYD06620.1 hypothetical protein N752_02825 [Desulforamulus aquiferis]